jgi:hypothetical protein
VGLQVGDGRAFVAVGHELSEQVRIEHDMETAVNLQLLHLVYLQDPLTTGAPRATLLRAGGVGVANSSDDMLDVVRAAGA